MCGAMVSTNSFIAKFQALLKSNVANERLKDLLKVNT